MNGTEHVDRADDLRYMYLDCENGSCGSHAGDSRGVPVAVATYVVSPMVVLARGEIRAFSPGDCCRWGSHAGDSGGISLGDAGNC